VIEFERLRPGTRREMKNGRSPDPKMKPGWCSLVFILLPAVVPIGAIPGGFGQAAMIAPRVSSWAAESETNAPRRGVDHWKGDNA